MPAAGCCFAFTLQKLSRVYSLWVSFFSTHRQMTFLHLTVQSCSPVFKGEVFSARRILQQPTGALYSNPLQLSTEKHTMFSCVCVLFCFPASLNSTSTPFSIKPLSHTAGFTQWERCMQPGPPLCSPHKEKSGGRYSYPLEGEDKLETLAFTWRNVKRTAHLFHAFANANIRCYNNTPFAFRFVYRTQGGNTISAIFRSAFQRDSEAYLKMYTWKTYAPPGRASAAWGRETLVQLDDGWLWSSSDRSTVAPT